MTSSSSTQKITPSTLLIVGVIGIISWYIFSSISNPEELREIQEPILRQRKLSNIIREQVLDRGTPRVQIITALLQNDSDQEEPLQRLLQERAIQASPQDPLVLAGSFFILFPGASESPGPVYQILEKWEQQEPDNSAPTIYKMLTAIQANDLALAQEALVIATQKEQCEPKTKELRILAGKVLQSFHISAQEAWATAFNLELLPMPFSTLNHNTERYSFLPQEQLLLVTTTLIQQLNLPQEQIPTLTCTLRLTEDRPGYHRDLLALKSKYEHCWATLQESSIERLSSEQWPNFFFKAIQEDFLEVYSRYFS